MDTSSTFRRVTQETFPTAQTFRGAAAGIVDAPLCGESMPPAHAPPIPAYRTVRPFYLSRGELAEKILVDLAQHVLCLVFRRKADFGDEVDQLPQRDGSICVRANRLSRMFLSEDSLLNGTSASSSRRQSPAV